MRPHRALLAAAIALAACGCRQTAQQLEPTPPERTDIPKIARQIPAHEPVAGTNARTALLFGRAIPDIGARIEVREYYVSEGNELTLPAAAETYFEIRGGQFEVTA